MEIVIAAIATWSLSGIIIAALLARHGHNFWLFALIGSPMGRCLWSPIVVTSSLAHSAAAP